jgi:hypothetical protein
LMLLRTANARWQLVMPHLQHLLPEANYLIFSK